MEKKKYYIHLPIAIFNVKGFVIGEDIDFCGVSWKLTDIKTTEEYIILEVE